MSSFRLAATLGLGMLGGCRAAMPSACTAQAEAGGAFEMLHLTNCTVYLSTWRADLTDALFDSWKPTNGWSQNPSGVRYTTMKKSCLYGSPGFAGAEVINIDAAEPWPNGPTTWTFLAQNCPGPAVLGGCFPDKCASDMNAVDGSLKYYEISKCHKMIWEANQTVNILTDPDGNKYIMHATTAPENAETGIPAGNAKIPEGWTRETQTLDSDLTLTPDPPESDSNPPNSEEQVAFGSFACGFALVQDSQGNAYHRIVTTTGNSKILPELHLIMGGLTPEHLDHTITVIVVIALVCACGMAVGCIVFCLNKMNNAKTDDTVGVQMSAEAQS